MKQLSSAKQRVLLMMELRFLMQKISRPQPDSIHVFEVPPLIILKNSGPPFKHNAKIWQMKVSYILLSNKTPHPQPSFWPFKAPHVLLKKHWGPPIFSSTPSRLWLKVHFPRIFQGACLASSFLCVIITKLIFKELQALNRPPTLIGSNYFKTYIFTKNSPFLKCFYYFKILMKLLPSRIFSHEDSFEMNTMSSSDTCY